MGQELSRNAKLVNGPRTSSNKSLPEAPLFACDFASDADRQKLSWKEPLAGLKHPGQSFFTQYGT